MTLAAHSSQLGTKEATQQTQQGSHDQTTHPSIPLTFTRPNKLLLRVSEARMPSAGLCNPSANEPHLPG